MVKHLQALNEEAGIAATVAWLSTGLHPSPAEIIVADGGSTDRSDWSDCHSLCLYPTNSQKPGMLREPSTIAMHTLAGSWTCLWQTAGAGLVRLQRRLVRLWSTPDVAGQRK